MGDDLSSIQITASEISCHLMEIAADRIASDLEHSFLDFLCIQNYVSEPCRCFASDCLENLENHVENCLTANAEHVHVCELFGGEGKTSILCSKLFGLKNGTNFEIKCGIDLNTSEGENKLFSYRKRFTPDVVVMAPPCKGFGPWVHLNRVISPDAVKEAQQVGVPLAQLCAAVAAFQLSRNKHFILEQPRNSTMFQLKVWKEIMAQLHVAVCDQCRFGLATADGIPLKKPTKFVASSDILLQHVSNQICLQNHDHAKVTSIAEVWPYRLCKSLALGIADLLLPERQKQVTSFYFPTYSCPGCRGHVRRDDPRHTHGDDCKYKGEETVIWSCEGCKKNRHRSHESHKLDHTCRWAIARTRDDGGPRDRRGHHPRDPRIPAAREPTASLRLEDAVPSSVAAEAVVPERLSAAEAAARRLAKSTSAVQAGQDPGLVEASGVVADGALAEPSASDAQSIIPAVSEPTWSRFDLGTSLQLLRSIRPGVIRRTLRKLHIRWYHAPARRMCTLLTAAGIPASVVGLVHDIVATCDVCRAWSRPGNRSMTSTRLPERFNLEVEIDLLFVHTHVILHMIDRCIRWSVAVLIPGRTTDSILNGIRDGWINQYGAPNQLISDQKGGLNEYAGAVLEQLHVKLTLKAKSQHAPVVERHNEILRRQIHLIDQQATNEGLRVSFQQILNEAVFSKNILMQYGGYSPYEALLGRTPPLLDVMSVEDDREREHPMRLRTLAAQSMLQAAAEDRIRRANQHKTRPAGELQGMQVGDLVDIYRPTLSKDVPRWNGPASITDLTAVTDGLIGVRWQGRNLQVRVQDCRRALAFLFAPVLFGGGMSPIEVLRMAAESFHGTMRVGWIKHESKWLACEGNRQHGQILDAALHVAAVNLQLLGVFRVRFGSKVRTLSGLYCDESCLCWWTPGQFQSWSYAFADGSKPVNLQNLGGENVAFAQFLMADGIAISELRQIYSDVSNVGRVHDPTMPLIREVPLNNPTRHKPKIKMIADKSSSNLGSPNNDVPVESEGDAVKDDVPAEIPQESPTSESEHELLPDEGTEQEPDAHIGWTCSAEPPAEPCALPLEVHSYVFDNVELDQPAELEISQQLAPYVVIPASVNLGSKFVFSYHSQNANAESSQAVIERTHNILTREEALQNLDACRASMLKDLGRWQKHGAWKRFPLSQSHNLLRSKWVLKWKDIAGKKDFKPGW